MITRLLYYISPETDPYINLAIERYLLDLTDENTLILYIWQNQNTVVIGRNQNPWAECRCAQLEKDGGKIARRLSGGGAVFHDLGNVNFTFLSSAQNADTARNMQIIQHACALEGITAETSGRNDITVAGKKFSGNAFYHTKDKCFHHGTLLVCADVEKMRQHLTPPPAKLVSKGVKSVSARVANLSDLSPATTCESITQNLIKAFSDAFCIPVAAIKTLDWTHIHATAAMYGSWEYIYGNTIDFSLSVEQRFDWGNVQVLLKIEDGTVNTVQTYTDAMDGDLPAWIYKALVNCPYTVTAITDRLSTLPAPFRKDILSLFENQGF